MRTAATCRTATRANMQLVAWTVVTKHASVASVRAYGTREPFCKCCRINSSPEIRTCSRERSVLSRPAAWPAASPTGHGLRHRLLSASKAAVEGPRTGAEQRGLRQRPGLGCTTLAEAFAGCNGWSATASRRQRDGSATASRPHHDGSATADAGLCRWL